MAPTDTPVAVSAPGKVLLAGGYLVLDRNYTGLVFGLSARINVIAGAIHTGPGVQLNEIVVDSPQFVDAQWRYGYHAAPAEGGIKVTQLQVGPDTQQPNPFVETTLSYALTFVQHVLDEQQQSGKTAAAAAARSHSLSPVRLIILADNDYYSQSTPTITGAGAAGRFPRFTVPLSKANKTGLGSSAALVTSLTAAVLSHYLPRAAFDLASPGGQQTLHNLAQAAHCAAQGKVGSGFDVAAAVYGSCLYRRFSPDILQRLPEPGGVGFGAELARVVRLDHEAWGVEVQGGSSGEEGTTGKQKKKGLRVPKGIVLRMCDVDCGSQTVGMVKQVLAWKKDQGLAAEQLWDALQQRNDELAALLGGDDDDTRGRQLLPGAIRAVRELIREMGARSGVPIEPPAQTELLDAVSAVEGVYGGVVPGAGGYDALALVMDDDAATEARVEARIAQWAADKAVKVRLLNVKGEMEGVRSESLDVYEGWL